MSMFVMFASAPHVGLIMSSFLEVDIFIASLPNTRFNMNLPLKFNLHYNKGYVSKFLQVFSTFYKSKEGLNFLQHKITTMATFINDLHDITIYLLNTRFLMSGLGIDCSYKLIIKLRKSCSIWSFNTAWYLFVARNIISVYMGFPFLIICLPELVSSVVDGHTTMRLTGISFSPHHKWFGE